MSQIIRHPASLGVFGLLAAMSASGQAEAAGFALREQSAEALGNAYAGSTAKAYDISTIYYNPAGMARLEGSQTGGSVTWIMPTAEFDGVSTRGNGARNGGGTGGDAIMDAAVGATYALWDINPDWKLGVAVTAPFGLRSHYKSDWVGRYNALTSNITNINVSPSLSYRINEHLSIGGGPQIDYTSVTLSQAIDFRAVGANDGKMTVQGDSIGFGGDLGLLWEFDPTARVGLNYRSQVHHTIQGKARFEGIPTVGGLSTNPAFAYGTAEATLTTPDTVSLGYYQDITPRWAVMSDLQWTQWSTFRTLRIEYANGRNPSVVEEHWRDTWFFSVGATYSTEDWGKFHFGTAYDQSAVKDAHRTARIPDSNRYWLSFGYSYDFSPGNQLNFGYAHLFADKANINDVSKTSLATNTLTGQYDSSVDIVSLGFNMKF
ncbi:OmpP1/FadL family transporter [Phaeospirillum tilakii]|uniref:OmpP1/FadL family transporter n=1 Tax=Phaeospirillum tilakii TaxID=741673 RepID=A0ABW5CAA2_9PROT